MGSSQMYKRSIIAALVLAVGVRGQLAAEDEDYARWYFSPGLGFMLTEDDQPLEDGMELNLRLGYDWNEWWSFEGGLLLAPKLDESITDNPDGSRTSQADPDVRGFGDTWMTTIYGDALFHFTRWERLDPYLAGGLGLVIYGEDVLEDGKSSELVMRGGGGVMYHFNDEWALRADGRMLVTSANLEINVVADAGVVWTWGAGVPPDILAVDGPIDSDGDGLSDEMERKIGTDPFDPDTDKDGLTDGQEVLTYKTDPLNPDTDFDMLKDGPEVLKHKTDPLNRDTDAGGVYDGHEVLEDNTNPLDGSDDLMMFELYLQFDYDKSVIKPQYFSDLDKIVKVLKRHPEASALIEGHADRLRTSKAGYNRRLSERRAMAVRQYIADKGVEIGRMRAVGYGFDRPKAQPDIINGTPENRRVEVFIRGIDRQSVLQTLKTP
ncbi:MAG: OmpA family protein [Kiritimatiellae bacterium]|nr:OmpA family protein [Kiritimatiellia bacterium]